jgi:hypothetical protein
MSPKLYSLTAMVFGAGFVGACSSASVPAGLDDSGATDTGTRHDSGIGETGTGDSGRPGDTGSDCCPSGFNLHSCTEKDGGMGLACHDPAEGCASSTMCGEGCDPVVTGTCGVTSALRWYTTCGYPVCGEGPDGGSSDAGVCPTVGSSCTTKGEACGTPDKANCGSTFVCDDHDPKGPGGDACPVSSRTFKDGIQYVGDAELQMLHDETLRVKLATYNYKSKVADPGPKHLGFIIEDNPASLSVDPTHNRVDLYGYVSMVVASMQVQEKEIAALRSELDATKRQAAVCAASRK